MANQSETIRKIILGFLSILIIWLGINGYNALVHSGKKISPTQTETLRKEVKVFPVKTRPIDTKITGYGTVRGKRETLIIPEVAGKIVYINPNFKSGKFVKKDEVLFKIDTQSTKILADKIKGEISKLQAQIQTTKQEEENVKRNLDIIKKHVHLAEKELHRKKSLFNKNMVSEQELDSANLKYLQETNSQTSQENQLALIPLKIKELEAALSVRRAELEDAILTLDKSTITAPFSGTIFEKSVEISQVLKAGEKAGTLVDGSVWEIPVDINAKHINHLNRLKNFKPSEYKSTVIWEGHNTVQWEGYISRIEKINEDTRTVKVIVEVPNVSAKDVPLTKGMFCRVILPGKIYNDAIVIPTLALRDNDTVYISEKSKLQIKKITILQQSEDSLIIGSGVSAGDKIIVSPLANPVIGMLLKEKIWTP